ncbi:MAG: aspartate kinase [Bacteroidales bacterium]|nr:aspartate kinase [Bacteroidales bacterium]
MSIVLKIGGSNLHNAKSLRQIAALVRHYNTPLILVVSAFNGITDRLYSIIRQEKKTEDQVHSLLDEIRSGFEDILFSELHEPDLQAATLATFNQRLTRLENLLRGIALIGTVPDDVEDEIVSFGERFSSLLINAYLQQDGYNSKELLPDDIGLFTDGAYHNATVDYQRSAPGLAQSITDGYYVVPGFYGISADRKITVFGRGGSDYSAAAIASCVNAQYLDVWKDVNGYMSGDPTLIDKPVPINALSYTEAAELSYFGAKILHPRTVEPLKTKHIPIRIFSFKQSGDKPSPYTIIGSEESELVHGIKSVTYSDEIRTLTLRGAGVGITPGILSKVTHQLEQRRLNIKSVITTQVAISLLLHESDMDLAHKLISDMGIAGIDIIDESDALSLIAAVGEGVLTQPGIAAGIFGAVANEKINVNFISFGASRVAIYFLVKRADRDAALKAIHHQLFIN